MTIAITYITLGILYMLACIADGQDVKPLWKRWLGSKLEGWADNLKPIDYCNRDRCMYYNMLLEAKRDASELRERLDFMSTRKPISVDETLFDAERIGSRMCIGEGELFRARMIEDDARRSGMPLHLIPRRETVDGMVDDAKRRCAADILKLAERYVTIEVETERFYPEIYVTGYLYVGKRR